MAGRDPQSVSEPGGNIASLVVGNEEAQLGNDIEGGVGTDDTTSNKDEVVGSGINAKEETSIPEKTTQMQSLEIDMENDVGTEQNAEESFDAEEDDKERLLGSDNKTDKDHQSTLQRQLICGCCEKPETVGNMTVFLPSRRAKTGWGVAGPHWFGPLCVLLLLSFASHYFIQISARKVGFVTEATCILFTLACAYNLANVAYRDPGVVKLQPPSQTSESASDEDPRLRNRWCDRCQVYQPPDGAHCSDCNVCVAGFDHHCVWMGTCIGKSNFKQFVAFNITWLLYLIYAITWVSVLGPLIFGRHKHHS